MTHLPSRLRRAGHTQDGAEAQSAHRRSRIGLGHLGLIVAVVALIALNTATLLSDRVHGWAYGIVSPVAQAICGASCLENSPAEVRKHEVDMATKKVTAQLAAQQARTQVLIAATETLVEMSRAASARTAALVSTVRAADSATKHLIATSDNLVVEHLALDRSHRQIKATASTVSARVAGRVAKSAARSVTTMASKAIPYVGTTVIWAATVLDVKDACDSMLELAKLDAETGVVRTAESRSVCGLRVPGVEELTKSVVSTSREAFQEAADTINGDGRITIAWDVVKWPYDTVKRTICYIFGC